MTDTIWTDQQEAEYQAAMARARELEAQRTSILGARQAATETVALSILDSLPDESVAGISGADLATVMRDRATAIRAALKPYDDSERTTAQRR